MKKKLNDVTKYLIKSKANKKALIHAIDEMKKEIHHKHELIQNQIGQGSIILISLPTTPFPGAA